MTGPVARLLPDGRRLHLQHGPIDIVCETWGAGRDAAHARAEGRFRTILDELVAELPALRRPLSPGADFDGPVARCMARAVGPFAPVFVTPMAAVAGAAADEIVGCLAGPGVARAYANNGGDVALYLAPGESFEAAIAGSAAQAHVRAEDPVRGVATSGWRGRSQSLGIADSVTVLAATAARADAAATLIANAVDLPDHPGIARRPAREIKADSDLGDRRVTTGVPPLSDTEIAAALDAGVARAHDYASRGLIAAAFLTLQGVTRSVGAPQLIPEPHDA